MDPGFEISVIICSYNRADYIIDALESLYNQDLSKDKFEVLVVDNNSTDNTAGLVRSYISGHPDGHFKYISETSQGASFARNTGAKQALSPLLCFMDDDAVAEKDFLKNILSFFSGHKNASGVGGRIIPRYIPGEPQWMSHYVSSLVGNFNYSNTTTVFSNNKYPLESNMTVRRSDFDILAGFNTLLPGVKGTLRIGGEGKDFFLRLYKLGKTVYYDPSIIVHHVVEVKKLTPDYLYRIASGYGRGEKIRTLSINKWAYNKKIAEYIYKLTGSFVLGLLYALKGKPSQSWPVIKFRIDALKGLLE
ncbi:MAG TPA: glycosyltransferase [Flavisolibacter sp.]|nr:glycosyltransferase [Flavisolibacter sp.]